MTCLSEEALEQFLSGHAPDGAAVEAHVSVCSDCRSALDRMSDKPELKRWLERAAALPTELAEDSVLKQLLTELGSADGDLSLHQKIGKREYHWHSGRVLGQYRVLEEIGRGGMGVVLRAYDELLGRVVALKVLRWEESDPKARARLVHEAQAVAKLRHDNVVTLHAVVNPPDDAPCLVMEHVEGGTLAALIKSEGRLDPKRAAAIVAEVADGLETAHAAGLIHRDIKPSNILVDAVSGRPKITDFGLARSTEQASGLTHESAIAGTPTHMSPEQARGGKDLDSRCDIYSLGVTLYEALTGTVPFHGAPHMVFQQVLSEEPLSLRRLNDNVPRDLETICKKAMAKEPGRRYQRASELADDLRCYKRGEPIHARPVGRLERGVSWCRRRPLVAGLMFALFLALAGGVAGISWNWADAVRQRRRMELERDRALLNFQQAREAVDTYLTQVSENSALKEQNLEPLRRDLLRTARDFYERFLQQDPDDPDLQAELGKAHGRLGQITSILESTPKALAHFEKMQEVFDRLHRRHPSNAAYQQELAESYLWLGDCLRTAGTSGQAEAAFERSRELRDDLARTHPEEPAYRHGLARTLRSVGQFAIFMSHDFTKAEQVLRSAREIFDRLPATYSQRPAVQYDRARNLSTLAKLYAHTDRPEEHRAAAEAAIAAFEPLAQSRDGNPDDICYLADSLSELADAYRRLGQPDLAETTLQKALLCADDLVRSHPANGYYQHVVADIAYSLASVDFHELHQPDQARVFLERALDTELKLTARYPTAIEYGFYLGNLIRDLRDWFGDKTRLTALRDHFTAAIQERAAQLPAETRVDEQLARAYGDRAVVHRLLTRYREAVADSSQLSPPNPVCVALSRAQEGDYAAAESALNTLAPGGDSTNAYEAARVAAYLSLVIRNDRSIPTARRDELAEKYAASGVQWLENARTSGYLSSPSTRYLLADDRDLDPLRSRTDFQALVARHAAVSEAGK